MSFRDILEKGPGAFMSLMLTASALILVRLFDVFCLKQRWGIEIALIINLIGLYFIYFIIVYFYQRYAILGRINIISSTAYLSESFTDPYVGKRHYGYLEVVIPINWMITDCYVTLERLVPIYFEDRVLIDLEFDEWYSSNVSPEYKLFHWKSPLSYRNGTKIDIGENSNKETFSVGKVITGEIKDTNGQMVDISTFEFDTPKNNPRAIHFTQCGLYEISIKFHWRRNGREMIGKKVDGYIYTRAEGGIREIRVGIGDYNDNKNVPKPLLKVEDKND